MKKMLAVLLLCAVALLAVSCSASGDNPPPPAAQCRGPGPRKPLRHPGAVFCAASWILFSWGYSIYVSFSDQFGAYGYLGTVMVVMMWLYYCMMFFLIGGCINVYFTNRQQQES